MPDVGLIKHPQNTLNQYPIKLGASQYLSGMIQLSLTLPLEANIGHVNKAWNKYSSRLYIKTL